MVTCDDPCAYHLGYRGTFATIEEATAYIDKDIASEPEALRLVLQWCEEGNTKALQDCLIRVSDIRRMGFTPPAGYRYGW